MKQSHRGFRSRLLTLTLGAALAMTPSLFAQAGSASGATPVSRITQAIDDQNLIRLTGNTPFFIKNATDLGAAEDSLQLSHMQLVLKRSTAQETALKQLLRDQQKVGSPNYHKWLTSEEFGERFGVSDEDMGKITGWLSSHGFTVEDVAKSRMVIEFSGTHEQLRAAFHTAIHQYSIHSEKHYANASDPLIPAAMAQVVSGFSTLTSYGPRPMHTTPQLAKRQANGKWQRASLEPRVTGNAPAKILPQFTDANNDLLVSPSDFATIYDMSPLWSQNIDGTGQTVAIVAQSDINTADVDAFRSAFGLPEKKLNVIYVGDNPGQTGDGVESEADLDVEWSGAVAKNATIDLVVSGVTPTGGGGVNVAAEYVIDNNLAPILSVSWGECELGLGTSGNQYFNTLWQQAAAEGITVIVAAGDSGSASCDQDQELAQFGEQVSGFASTPYNTAVGGTDFSADFQNASQYWNSTNDPTTLASAKSYIPETPWNDTCASPQVLTAVQTLGIATDTTNEAFCNDLNISEAYGFLNTAGGGGGASNCTTSDGNSPTSCTGGYSTPDWQLQMPGMPSNGVRNVPDVSLFAGNGLWGSAYVFCQSDASPDGTCNYQNGDVQYLTAGGTSFAAPAFAGVVALMNQNSQSALGNINYTLYQLGAAQYGNNGTAVYHDITAGSNAVQCYAGTIAVPPSTNCPINTPGDILGILPGFSANSGYDLASGLGSIDVAAFANAWAATVSGLKTTTTTMSLTGSATATYGTPMQVQIQVTAASGSPTGAAALFDEDTATGVPLATAQLASGSGTFSANGIPAGTHDLYARYAGDGTFATSSSTALPITITQATTTMNLSASHTSIVTGQSVSFAVNVETSSTASSPTGVVTFTDMTTGQTLGTASVNAQTDPSTGASIGHAFLNIPGQRFASGQNTITATYAGDGNYTGSNETATISYTGPFSLNLAQSSITLPPGASAGNTVVITVTPNGGTTLNPASLGLSCPGTLPQGLTCAFSAPAMGSNGAVSSTLTILQSSPLVPQSMKRMALLGTGSITGLACLFLLGLSGRKRHFHLAAVLFVATVLLVGTGCGSGSKSNNSGNNGNEANAAATTTSLSASSVTPNLNSQLTLSSTVATLSGKGSPTGSVTFLDGANVLGSGTLSGGTATYSTSVLSVGQHSLTATYGGDSTYSASTSNATQVDVVLSAPLTIEVADNAGNVATQTLTVTVK